MNTIEILKTFVRNVAIGIPDGKQIQLIEKESNGVYTISLYLGNECLFEETAIYKESISEQVKDYSRGKLILSIMQQGFLSQLYQKL